MNHPARGSIKTFYTNAFCQKIDVDRNNGFGLDFCRMRLTLPRRWSCDAGARCSSERPVDRSPMIIQKFSSEEFEKFEWNA